MAKASFCFRILLGYIWLSEFFVHSQGLSEPLPDTFKTKIVSKDAVHDAEVRLRSDLMKNYNIDVLPPHNDSSPVVVRLGLQIISIKDLDPKTQALTTEGYLKMGWHDTRLVWDPKEYAGITVIRFVHNKIWKPDILLYNSAKMSEMEVKTEVFTLVYSSGEMIWIPPVTLLSLCDVDLKYYPYDKHTCKYKFGSWTHGGDHIDIVVFDKDGSEAMDLSDTWNKGGEWEIVGTSVAKSSTVYSCCPESYPDVTHSVTLQRRSPFYRVSILCPLIASAFLLLISFWVYPESYYRITLNIVSFLTTFTILMHLSSELPAVGNSCPIVMIFCGILLMISALTTIISLFFMIIIGSKTNEQAPEWIKSIVQSSIMKLCCIVKQMHGNEGDYSLNLVTEDDPKVVRSSTNSKPNIWTMFFQLIDRLLFVICVIIIISVISVSM